MDSTTTLNKQEYYCIQMLPQKDTSSQDLPDSVSVGQALSNHGPTGSSSLKNKSSPLSIALMKGLTWNKGTTLTVAFIGGSPIVREKVQQYACIWTQYANINFSFVSGPEANIRIAFKKGAGSWSYVGRESLNISSDEPTMNFGWFDDSTPDAEFSRTVLHEFGHALGAVHEHSAPGNTIDWNKAAVYAAHPEWSEEDVDLNIFNKYKTKDVSSSMFDTKSIMMYSIPIQWTQNGFSTEQNFVLSDSDINFIRKTYPFPTAPVVRSLNRAFKNDIFTENTVDEEYESPFPIKMQSPSMMPGTCITKLSLGPDMDKINLHIRHAYADEGKHRYEAVVEALRSDNIYPYCQEIGVKWLELPDDYDVQHGVFQSQVEIHPAATTRDRYAKRINFDKPFTSNPKVVVFFSQLYVDRKSDYKAGVEVIDIDLYGFTVLITPANQTSTNSYSISWMAHPTNSQYVASGELEDVFKGSSSNKGHMKFEKPFKQPPVVLAGLKRIEFRDTNKLSVEIGTDNASRTGVDWYTNYGMPSFGTAMWNYIAFGA